LFLPLVILFYNKGYRSVNRYLAGYLFFSSLYLLESFTFFYGVSLNFVAFSTISHDFIFYLFSPLSFFYVRGVLRDNTKMDKKDWLHFLPFILSLAGSIPYIFSTWDFKLLVAQNLLSEQWDMSQFDLNIFIPHKVNQVLNVFVMYFYAGSLWYLIWKYKRNSNNRIYHVPQFKLIRNWLFFFTLIISIITLNFSITMADVLIYDDKSVFLEKASGALLLASIVYIVINMGILFFPHIMYGLPVGNLYQPIKDVIQSASPTLDENYLDVNGISAEINKEPELFSSNYVDNIEAKLQKCIRLKSYLQVDFSLSKISDDIGIPAHHLTYFFNDIKKISFSVWRNGLRIEEAKILIRQGETNNFTMQSISQKSGFSSQNTFIRAFKNATGTTPSTYLKSIS
jgi:AraC-like DNA-binding protein